MKTEQNYIEGLQKHLVHHHKIRLDKQAAKQKVWSYYCLPLAIALVSIPVYWKVNPIMSGMCLLIAVAVSVYIVEYYSSIPQGIFQQYCLKILVPIFYKSYEIDAHFSFSKSINASNLRAVFPIDSIYQFETRYLLQSKAAKGPYYRVSEFMIHSNTPSDKSLIYDGLLIELKIPYAFEADILVVPKQKTATFWYENTPVEGFRTKQAAFFSSLEKKYHLFSHNTEVAKHLLQGPLLTFFLQQRRFDPVLRIIDQGVFLFIDKVQLVPDSMLEDSWSDQQLKEIYQAVQWLFHWVRLFNTKEQNDI
jgi:hypothetical protein